MPFKKLFRFKNAYKFLIPLVLIAVGFEIFLVSPKTIGNNTTLPAHNELIKPVDGQGEREQAMEGIQLVELRQGEKEWQLWAEKAFSLKESGRLILEVVKVKIFGTQGAIYYVTGARGEVDTNKKDIMITGNVVTKTSNGYTMKTDKTFYNSADRTLDSPNQVFVTGPQEKKNEGPLILTGLGMHTELKDNEIRILKDVKSHKVFSDGRKFTLQSNTAKFKSINYTAFFDGDVIMDMQNSRITGDNAVLEVSAKTREVYSMTVLGKVRLTDVQRWAVAREAVMIFPEKKFILRGSPRVVQQQDEIKGEEITFLNEGKEIQIKRAKAKFDKEGVKKYE